MDEADLASINEEKENEMRLKYALPLVQEAQATGFCLFCEEPLNDNRRWCDRECVALWERNKRERTR